MEFEKKRKISWFQDQNHFLIRLILLLSIVLILLPGFNTKELWSQVTSEDYARAERFLGWNARKLVSYDSVEPVWLNDGRFWYLNRIPDGYMFVLVDPQSNTQRPAFDHTNLAAALSEAIDRDFHPHRLPFNSLEFTESGKSIQFWLKDKKQWQYNLSTHQLTGPVDSPPPPIDEVVSPDGKWAAFQRNENLWIRSIETGEESQLSKDGEENFGYAVTPEGCCRVITNRRLGQKERPVLIWSPDSKKIATHQLDERNVRQLHLLETKLGRPILHSYHYALPGEPDIPTYKMYIFDIQSRTQIEIKKEAQDMVNTSCCGLMSEKGWKDVRWGPNSQEFFFTFGRRGFQKLDLIAADITTGETRIIIEEQSPTFVEMNAASGGFPNWEVINGGREIIWFSERSGWGHLYLYDAKKGNIKKQITSGPWLVLSIERVDEVNRWLYFTAVGREKDLDPYFRQLYRIRWDGSGLERLTPEPFDHTISTSSSGQYFIDTYSKRDTAPTTVLRRTDGKVVRKLETGDISRLRALGWPFPASFIVKARDGMTDLYGFLHFPSHFDENKKYPLIDYIYPGPQIGPIGYRNFTADPRRGVQALAELGFIVIQLDAMGTPLRSKSFHDIYYGNMGDNGIIDHVLAIKQLALQYPQIDLDRVGIFGHSGGGFSSTGALLRFPDFFKVAVSSAGNHDQRSYDYTWGEKYQGLLKKNDNETDNFDSQANHLLAKNLKGKLLLMYGTLDDNVHPNATLLVIKELIKHNKDFDLLVLPNRNHGHAGDPYVVRKTWDYFVKHLLGFDPPAGYKIEEPPQEPWEQ